MLPGTSLEKKLLEGLIPWGGLSAVRNGRKRLNGPTKGKSAWQKRHTLYSWGCSALGNNGYRPGSCACRGQSGCARGSPRSYRWGCPAEYCPLQAELLRGIILAIPADRCFGALYCSLSV